MTIFGLKIKASMKTIAIAAGGDSSEFEISVKSAQEVGKILSSGYIVYIIVIRGTSWYWEDKKGRYHNIDKNDFSLLCDGQRIKFDGVFIAIHGTPGENGLLQGYFDMMGIPYSSCGSFCSALTFNKQACKLFLKEYGILMAKGIQVRNEETFDQAYIIDQIGLPCFVKPNDSGSSFGVAKVKTIEELVPAIENAFKESNTILVESFMNGREIACGVLKTKDKMIVLPLIEIISKNEFFDYEAKYTPGKSEEIAPADISPSITTEIQRISKFVYELLGCKGIVRVDFIIVGDKPFFIEINTVPGMTKESLVPKEAAAAGISLEELYSMAVENMFG
jgi:D-alanine-D-alanine ligase